MQQPIDLVRGLAPLALLLSVACGGSDSATPSAADAAPPPTAEAPAPEAPAATAPAPTADRGSLGFEVDSGPHAGSYGGALSDDSVMSVRKVGDMTLLVLRIVHERDDGTTDVFTANLNLAGEVGVGDIDLTGQMATSGHLPDGVDQDPRFFSLTAAAGSGTLSVTAIDPTQGTIEATYTLSQDGVAISGRFALTPARS